MHYSSCVACLLDTIACQADRAATRIGRRRTGCAAVFSTRAARRRVARAGAQRWALVTLTGAERQHENYQHAVTGNHRQNHAKHLGGEAAIKHADVAQS
jgi:hypothetical protein